MTAAKTEKKSIWDTFMSKFRDIVFILMFIVTSVGWIVTATKNKTEMSMVLQQNTQAINDLKGEIKSINSYITQQSELNGKIIQFMNQKK